MTAEQWDYVALEVVFGVKPALRSNDRPSPSGRTPYIKAAKWNIVFSERNSLATLDDFRLELLKYIEANRPALESAPFGLYAVVPPSKEYKVIAPGVIFCLRHAPASSDVSVRSSGEAINPLQPHFLVYVLEDGNVRFGFAHPKQILEIFRLLCSGRSEPYGALCNLFDQQTNHGADMKICDVLLKQAVTSIANTFRSRAASGLQSGRGFVLPNQQEQVHEHTDLELVTWLVIKHPQ